MIKEKFITMQSAKVHKSLESDFDIEEGEASAIALALTRKHKVATDDLKAIKACKILNIPFITAIHCLISLKRRGVLSREIAIEKLKNLEYYGRYSEEIMSEARKTLEEP
jgi:predicted nucleic acid-binding protein